MFRPRGVVNPIGFASPGMAKVLTCPVARVSTSVPPLPEKTWNSARWPSGDQAISCGANRQSGHLASWYLVPDGLIRYSSAGPGPGDGLQRPRPGSRAAGGGTGAGRWDGSAPSCSSDSPADEWNSAG